MDNNLNTPKNALAESLGKPRTSPAVATEITPEDVVAGLNLEIGKKTSEISDQAQADAVRQQFVASESPASTEMSSTESSPRRIEAEFAQEIKNISDPAELVRFFSEELRKYSSAN